VAFGVVGMNGKLINWSFLPLPALVGMSIPIFHDCISLLINSGIDPEIRSRSNLWALHLLFRKIQFIEL